MSRYDYALSQCHRLEDLLRNQYHAQGDNLDQLLQSCEERLPHQVVDKLHNMVTLSEAIQDERWRDEDIDRLEHAIDNCFRELAPRSGRLVWGAVGAVLMLMTAAALIFYYLHWELLAEHMLATTN